MSRHTRWIGGGRRNDTKCHIWGGGGVLKMWKKCRVLFEWPLNLPILTQAYLNYPNLLLPNLTHSTNV